MREQILEYWYLALRSPHGVAIKSNNPLNTTAYLYRVRRDSGDPDLSSMHVVTSPIDPKSEVWIIHGNQNEAKNLLDSPTDRNDGEPS